MKNTALALLALFLLAAAHAQTAAGPTPITKSPRIYSRITSGVLAGKEVTTSAQAFVGYSFNTHLQAGIGMGLERMLGNRYAPMLLEFRYHLLKRPTSPFVELHGGYLAPIGWKSLFSRYNNFTAGAALGFTHYYTSHIAITASLGYRISRIDAIDHYYSPYTQYYVPIYGSKDIGQIELRIGVVLQ